MYFVPPASRPDLEKSIEECGLMDVTAFTCRPNSYTNKRSLASVIKQFKFNFYDAKLKDNVIEFFSAMTTRRETAVFLECHPSMVADKGLKSKLACLRVLQELLSGAKVTSPEGNRFQVTFSDGITATIASRNASPIGEINGSGYQVNIRSQAGSVINSNEVSALAVGILTSSSEDKDFPKSCEPHTFVLLATRTTDGRVALGGSNIGRKKLYFNWKAEQKIFDLSSKAYNRSPGEQKDWVVITLPDKDDPEYEAKMVAVRLLVEETLAAFAKRPLLTAADEQRCKEAVDSKKEVEMRKAKQRRYVNK